MVLHHISRWETVITSTIKGLITGRQGAVGANRFVSSLRSSGRIAKGGAVGKLLRRVENKGKEIIKGEVLDPRGMVLACKIVGTEVPHLMAEDERAVGALGQLSLEKIGRKNEEEVEVHVALDMAVNNKGFNFLHIPSKNL